MQLCREQAAAEPENREFAVPLQLRMLLALRGGALLAGGGTSRRRQAAAAGRSFVVAPESLSDGREGKQRKGCRGGFAACALLLLSQQGGMSQGKRVELHP